jgi:DNA polymerase III subunit epsilon
LTDPRIFDHLVSTLPLVVIDFETTGPDPLKCEPVEVAAMRIEIVGAPDIDDSGCFVEVGSFSTLLRPSGPIDPEATKIHGITDDMVKDAPQLQDVARELLELAQDALPCAYNEPFDRTVLHRYVSGTDCPLFDPSLVAWLDVYVMIARIDRYIPGTGRHKLAATCERYGVPHESAHRALGDCRATARLLAKLVDLAKVDLDVPAEHFLRAIKKVRAEQDAERAAYRAKRAALEAAKKG